MKYIIFFIILIIIQWVIFLDIIELRCKKIVIKNTKSIELVKKYYTKQYCALICIEMIFFTGFRALDVGVDNGTYLAALEYYKGLTFKEIFTAKLVYPFDFEIGYFFLVKLCAFLNFNDTAFLLLISIIIYVPLFSFIYKNSHNPLISIIVYFTFGFFGYSIGLFRQMIAMSICLLAVSYLKEKRCIKYCLVCACASLFHLTALIMIPFYWFNKVNIKKHYILILILTIVIELLCFVFSRDIIIEILRIIPNYSGYIGSAYDVQGGTYLGLIYLNLLFVICMIFVLPQVGNEEELSIKAILIACVIQSCSYSMGIMGRLVTYYSIYEIILFPLIMEQLGSKKKICNIILVILLLITMYITLKEDTTIKIYRFI